MAFKVTNPFKKQSPFKEEKVKPLAQIVADINERLTQAEETLKELVKKSK